MQLDFLRLIQSASNPVLDLLAQGFTMLGEPFVLAGIFCAVYWCVDKEAGRQLLITLCASLCLNGIVKDLVRAPRPIGQEGIVSLRVHTATGYSFPSGHTQSTAAFWSSMALSLPGRRTRLIAVLMMVCVGFSRLYLGVHYPVDVLGGLVLGSLTALLIHRLLRRSRRRIALLVCAVLCALAFILGESDDTIAAAGMVLGMLSGLWLESKYAGFSLQKLPFSRRAIRYVVGLGFVGGAYLVLHFLLPGGGLFKALRYGVLVFGGIGVYPVLFTRLKL